MRYVLIFLLLAACAPYAEHQPDLVSAPSNEQKYANDLDFCRQQVKNTQTLDKGIDQGLATAAFGPVGMIVSRSADGTYDKIDNCLRTKGYKITSN